MYEFESLCTSWALCMHELIGFMLLASVTVCQAVTVAKEGFKVSIDTDCRCR